MSFKFALNELVELENSSVGRVICREEKEDIDGIDTTYTVSFLEDSSSECEEKELKKTTKKDITTDDGKSKWQLDKEEIEEYEKNYKREKAQKMCHDIGEVILRYKDKCKDGKTFWQFFKEDVEDLVYKELGAEKESRMERLRKETKNWLPVYTRARYGNPDGWEIKSINTY